MKKLLLVSCFTLLGYSVFAQALSYSTVEYFTVDSNTYMLERGKAIMRIANRNNNKQDSCYYYKDGREALGTWDDYAMAELNDDGVMRSMTETFTSTEIESVKNTRTPITITCVFDDKGRVVECSFIFPQASVLQSFPKERFATLEQKVKQYVTTSITDENTKKLKYVFGATRISLWKR